MTIDLAGNTLGSARNISLGNTFQDWVGSTDTLDFYRFNISSRGSVGITLSGMTSDADLRLIRDRNNNGRVDSGEVLATSILAGTQIDRIVRDLEAGTYFIQVNRFSGNTNYTLQTQFQPDKGGDTLLGASQISVGPTTLTFSDRIGGADANDYYRFSLAATSDLQLSLSGLSGNADVQVLNANGTVVASSTASGTLNEAIARQLDAGTYYLRVFPQGGATTAYTLGVSATPAPTPTPLLSDWFSQNLRDQGLVSAARSLAADGIFSRTDMLSLFRNAQDGGLIDGNEIGDLRTLVANSSRFQMTDSLRWLSNQVANGAALNMSATTFEQDLVGRWFLGTVAPTATFNNQTLAYTQTQGTLFGSSGQARIGDIDQGSFMGNCAFLAALGATFAPQAGDAGNSMSTVINNMILDNGDNTYTIRFYAPGSNGQMEAQYVTVDRRLATQDGRHFGARINNGVLWVALTERAYAQWREWREGQPGYNLIGNGDNLSRPLQFVTGRRASEFYTTYTFEQISNGLQTGRALTAGRYESTSTDLIVGGHAYSITQAYVDSTGQQRVVVRNPWGIDGRTTQGSNDGFIDLSFTDFRRSFGGVGVA